jgi:hypothetical protein
MLFGGLCWIIDNNPLFHTQNGQKQTFKSAPGK